MAVDDKNFLQPVLPVPRPFFIRGLLAAASLATRRLYGEFVPGSFFARNLAEIISGNTTATQSPRRERWHTDIQQVGGRAEDAARVFTQMPTAGLHTYLSLRNGNRENPRRSSLSFVAKVWTERYRPTATQNKRV